MSTAGIIGLGLIGGSMARDLARAGWRVQGIDADPATEAAAREDGVIGGRLDPAGVDILVLAVPLRHISSRLTELGEQIPSRSETVVCDVGSTKRSILAAADAAGLGPRFVGAHPMAGDHRSGWDASRAGLFSDATVWICPGQGVPTKRVERVEALWRECGARPHRIDPTDHDRLLARSSHLPQAVASALAVALSRAGVELEDLGPGGRDTTRLAGSDPSLWTDILLDNADEVAPAIDSLGGTLLGLRKALRSRDAAALRALLEGGREWRGL